MTTKKQSCWLSLSLAILIIAPTPALGSTSDHGLIAEFEGSLGGWRVRSRDNICGLSNPRQLTQPARVNYKQVLRATEEMKDLVRRNIDPSSAEGQILRQRAVDRVRRASSLVMQSQGYCSVWKRISHKDARSVAEVTGEVVASLSAA
ncbi:MAG: hypothetical protein MK297_08435 [Planctomycetes bacterium]|nr:hypothetical protein [Planctomycetota bacterium]